MANSKKSANGTEEKVSASAQVWRSVRDSVKTDIRNAAETASLRMQLTKAEKEKKELFRRLGMVRYEQLRPKRASVMSELDARTESISAQIDAKTQEITKLKLTLELRKLGAGTASASAAAKRAEQKPKE